ncbi:glutaredoxin family protein [Suttonella sp. R2A3]|uniref:glutaredoxin family protein n=1 Tax=Suttonella sp. R2A3 TaxID=2908648 RepID=UPI001F2926D5|nr:glutaredoxin family protein [Suttonella sp. R2A3]UJF24043.1 glutaredoxin family protein [Suttonella sp. R2A3]
MREKTLQLMSRQGCHLCQHAEHMLRAQNAVFTVLDIDQSSALQARYGVLVPVVYCPESDQELLYPFNTEQLAVWLAEQA